MPTIADTLAQARAHRAAGDLASAELFCRRVLQADSGNVEALDLLGEVCQALGQLSEAESILVQAARLKPGHAETHNNLGVVLGRQEKLQAAVDCFRRAVQLKPDYAAAHTNLGVVLERQGSLDQAEASYRRALESKPNFAEGHNNLGAVLGKHGKWDEAILCFWRAVELKPEYAEAHHNLGATLAKQKKLDEAAACCRRAISLAPDFAEAHRTLAAVLWEQNKLDEAAACYRRALELKPDEAETHNSLGAVLARQGSLDEAVACYRRSLELNPGFARAHNNLAIVLAKQGQFDEAAACCRRALALKPDFAEAQNCLGTLFTRWEQFDEAIACYRRALELQPDFADAHLNHAFALLLLGRFAEGWSEYEWRFKRKGKEEPNFFRPRWMGAALADCTILLHTEQGLGDALQFIRYAARLKQQGATVIVECLPALTRLLATCDAVDAVIARGSPLPKFDLYVPLLSLPGIYQTSLENIPANVPYLAPAEESVQQWKRELGDEPGTRIGIAWQGNPDLPFDRFRSIPLARFAGIARVPGVRLYSLQVGAGREQLAAWAGPTSITDLGDRLQDLHDTAAVMRNLDLVIACDSAPAHLAGALGVKAWVALPLAPDWRWMLERADCAWYPTMRLFRQSAPGDWNGVFRNIERELATFVQTLYPNRSRSG